MFFGEKLREIRLNYFKMGLHKFKDVLGTTIDVSELSNIEHGYVPPINCGRFFAQLWEALKKVDNTDPNKLEKDFDELISLRWEPFIMQKMPENIFPSLCVHKSDGSPLSKDELEGLYYYMESIAKEHNKKADEYNKNNK